MEKMKKIKQVTANIILAASVLLIIGVVIYGVRRSKDEPALSQGSYPARVEEDTYYLNEHELAEFSDVIVEEFRKESKLVVSSVEASVSVDLKQTGIFNIAILNKSQKVVYKGSGTFYVDLSRLGKHSIRLDNDRALITIEIPHTELAPVEIDPDKFSYEETEKGLLAFGELKFTAKEYNSLETECKRRLNSAVDTETNRRLADERAVEEMIKIYEPIVKAVDDIYSVEIVFVR